VGLHLFHAEFQRGGGPPVKASEHSTMKSEPRACGSLQVPPVPSIEVHDDLGMIPKPNVTDDHEADREPLPT
jgi:hypothetical protein